MQGPKRLVCMKCKYTHTHTGCSQVPGHAYSLRNKVWDRDLPILKRNIGFSTKHRVFTCLTGRRKGSTTRVFYCIALFLSEVLLGSINYCRASNVKIAPTVIGNRTLRVIARAVGYSNTWNNGHIHIPTWLPSNFQARTGDKTTSLPKRM